jgi:hypothetical protein
MLCCARRGALVCALAMGMGVCVSSANSALGKPAAATRSISLGGQGICERHKKGTGDVQKKERHRIWVVPVQRSHPRGGGGLVWRAMGR